MMNLANIQPGARVTFVMNHDAAAMDKKMKTGRGDNRNPLLGRVSRVLHLAGNAAGTETYSRKLDTLGETPAGAPSPWMDTEFPCVVALKSNPSRLAVRVVNSTTQHCALFLDGRPMTEAEATLFATWKKSSGGENPTGYANLGVENLANAELPE